MILSVRLSSRAGGCEHREIARQSVGFVKGDDHRPVGGTNLLQYLLNRLDLVMHCWTGGINDMDQQISLSHFLKRGAEGCNERGRQALYKAHSIGEQDLLATS